MFGSELLFYSKQVLHHPSGRVSTDAYQMNLLDYHIFSDTVYDQSSNMLFGNFIVNPFTLFFLLATSFDLQQQQKINKTKRVVGIIKHLHAL